MTKEYYKVVRRIDGRLVSALVASDQGQRTYSSARWTNATWGPLFCFDSQQAASNFAFGIFGLREVWRCKVKRPRRIRWIAWCKADWIHKRAFWRLKRSKQQRENREAPDGSIVADAIKLVEQVG